MFEEARALGLHKQKFQLISHNIHNKDIKSNYPIINNFNMSEASTAVPHQSQPDKSSISKPPSLLKSTYLVLYNFVSAVLWLTVFGRVVSISLLMRNTDMVFKTTSEFTKWTQTLALLEVAHSALGEFDQNLPIQVFKMLTLAQLKSLTCSPSMDVLLLRGKSSIVKRRETSTLALHESQILSILTSDHLQVSSALPF